MNWKVLTPGPVIDLKNLTINQAKKYVEENAPLKRGWRGEWETSPTTKNVYRYRRYNSKGNILRGYDIQLVPARLWVKRMKYNLRVQYKSGTLITKANLSALQLRCELADRLVDNNKEASVEKWEISPVSGTEES